MMNRMLFSILASSAIFAGSAIAGNSQQTSSFLTLEELKAKCHERENHSQADSFTSTFTCQEDKTFWVQNGIRHFGLENRSEVKIKALIKDGAHETEWWSVPGQAECVQGACPVFDQWKSTARYTVTFRSCAELDAVKTEHEFCQAQLRSVWDECDAEVEQALTFSPFQAPAKGLCQYENLNVTKSCVDADTAQQSQCQQEPTQCVKFDQSQQGSQQDNNQQQDDQASQQDSCDSANNARISEYELGAEIKVTRVNRGFFHHRHDVVLINSDVQVGGMLHKLGLQKGDAVSMIDGRRTRNERDFLKALARAKAKGEIRMEVRSSVDGKFRNVSYRHF